MCGHVFARETKKTMKRAKEQYDKRKQITRYLDNDLIKPYVGITSNIFSSLSINPQNTPSIFKYPIKRKFDIIAFEDFFEYQHDIYLCIVNCLAILNPNGKIVIKIPINNEPIGNFTARTHEFRESSLKTMLNQIEMPYDIKSSLLVSFVTIY